MRHMDLFSGIGGFALAVRWLGGKTVVFCDSDSFCQKVLAKNFPGTPIHGDITTMRGDAYGPVDLVTGGFPCQPYSVAGKRRGANDDRHLWPEMARVIAEAKPRYVLGENTPGINSLDLDRVLSEVEGLGYTAWAIALPAIAVDSRQIRERTWIMAHADCEREQQPQRRIGNERQRSGDGRSTARTLPDTGRIGYGASDETLCAGWDAPIDGGRWPAEPYIPRMAHGIPRGVDRRRALGNAIVPQVAYEILRVMLGGDA